MAAGGISNLRLHPVGRRPYVPTEYDMQGALALLLWEMAVCFGEKAMEKRPGMSKKRTVGSSGEGCFRPSGQEKGV